MANAWQCFERLNSSQSTMAFSISKRHKFSIYNKFSTISGHMHMYTDNILLLSCTGPASHQLESRTLRYMPKKWTQHWLQLVGPSTYIYFNRKFDNITCSPCIQEKNQGGHKGKWSDTKFKMVDACSGYPRHATSKLCINLHRTYVDIGWAFIN